MYVNCTSAENSTKKCATAASRKQVKCYKHSGAEVARLTRFFNDYNWNGLVLGIDCGTLSVDQAFADFDNILHYAFDQIVGYSTVTIRERDPTYITPYIKVLLRKRNKLLRRGKVDLALPVTKQIGKMIADGRSKLLSKTSASDTKRLWKLLRNTGNWSNRAPNNNVDCSGLALTADDLNAYFAEVATDPHYSQNELENLCCSFSEG